MEEVINEGDRVICIDGHDSNNYIIWKLGTVIGNAGICHVDFDEDILGHKGCAHDQHCWNVPKFKLKKIY